ncbi:MAG: hypothetical protein ACOX41_09910 [Anaerovoracaceae bacterium]|jgi:hypothetical protein
MNHKRTYNLALGGICTGAATAALCLASVVPGVELTLYAISSVFLYLVACEAGLRAGLIACGATALLGFLLMPGKLGILPFLVLFGLYPVLKPAFEKLGPAADPAHPYRDALRPVRLLPKLLYFVILAVVCFGLFRGLFLAEIQLPRFGHAGLAVYALVMFLLYDIILTGILCFYQQRIRPALQGRPGENPGGNRQGAGRRRPPAGVRGRGRRRSRPAQHAPLEIRLSPPQEDEAPPARNGEAADAADAGAGTEPGRSGFEQDPRRPGSEQNPRRSGSEQDPRRPGGAHR